MITPENSAAFVCKMEDVLGLHHEPYDPTTEWLDRRIPDAATLRAEVAAWERTRNDDDSASDWQFTNDDARIKLRQLYPANHD